MSHSFQFWSIMRDVKCVIFISNRCVVCVCRMERYIYWNSKISEIYVYIMMGVKYWNVQSIYIMIIHVIVIISIPTSYAMWVVVPIIHVHKYNTVLNLCYGTPSVIVGIETWPLCALSSIDRLWSWNLFLFRLWTLLKYSHMW